MMITYNRDRFEAVSSYDEKDVVKAAGFRWDSAARIWWTADAAVAARLAEFADGKARTALDGVSAEPAPKRQPMRMGIDPRDGAYRFYCAIDEREIAKAAGFRFQANPEPRWWTNDALVAKKLLKHADAAARAKLERAETEAAEAEAASRAVDTAIEVPVPAERSYLPYQKAGIAWAASRSRTMLNDSMGLGKSAQALGTTVLTDGFPLLVVCPASIKLNWKNEAAKFLPGEGWVVALNGKPSSEIIDALARLVPFDSQVGQQSAQKGEHVGHVAERELMARLPRHLRAWRLTAASGDERATELFGEEVHHALMCVVHRDAPAGACPTLGDRALAVEESSDVGQENRIGRHGQRRGSLVAPDEAAGSPPEVAVEHAVGDAQVARHGGNGFTRCDSIDGAIDDDGVELVPSGGVDHEATATQQQDKAGVAVADLRRDVREPFAGVDAFDESGKDSGFETTDRHVTLIVNYDVLDAWLGFLTRLPLRTIVLDEIHYCKAPKAQRTKASKALVAAFPRSRVLGLTGTPLLNRPAELIAQLEVLGEFKRIFGSWREFVVRHCNGHQTRFGWDISGASNLDALQIRLRETIMIRRLKEDVLLDLPAIRRQVVVLAPETADADRALHRERAHFAHADEERARLMARLELSRAEGDKKGFRAAVAALRMFRSAEFTELARLRRETAIAKLPIALPYLDDAVEESGKLIVFAHHHVIIDALVAHFGARCVKLDGRDSLDTKQQAVDRFQQDPSVRVFIGQMTAAGVGITLTASSHVVFVEGDWTPGVIAQAESRAHRIGQRDSVLVQHLVLEGSIDAKMARILIEKQEVIDAALDDRPEPDETDPMVPEAGGTDDALAEVEERIAARREEAEAALARALAAARAARDAAQRTAAEAAAEKAKSKLRRIEAKLAQREATLEARPSTSRVSAKKIAEMAEKIAPAQAAAVHANLRLLAGLDPDRAFSKNDVGFNRADGALGHALADLATLTPRQAVLGRLLAQGYLRQLGEERVRAMGEEG